MHVFPLAMILPSQLAISKATLRDVLAALRAW